LPEIVFLREPETRQANSARPRIDFFHLLQLSETADIPEPSGNF